MRAIRQRCFVAGLVLSAGLFAVCDGATARDAARIIRVERVEAADPHRMGPTPTHMSKFLRERAVDARPVYMVKWNAGIGTAAGTLVTFEYRQDEDGHVKFLANKYEVPLKGEQETVFSLPEGARVAAWRARLVYRGRRLAETTSGHWR